MSANTTPKFIDGPVIAQGDVSTANTNVNGSTGAYTTIATGATNGTVISLIRIKARVTTTAGMVRLFLDGKLWKEIPVAAVTRSATVPAFETEYIPTGDLTLPSGVVLKASTEKGELMGIFAHGGDL